MYNIAKAQRVEMDNTLEQYRLDMIESVSEKYELDGEIQSKIPNLDFYFSPRLIEKTSIMYQPSLCVILQGEKEVHFGNNIYTYNTNDYLLSSADLPAQIKLLEASAEKPYLSLRVKFTLEEIYEVIKTLDKDRYSVDKNADKGLFFNQMSLDLYSAVHKLMMLLDKPQEDIDFLYPLYTKEILFHLVKGESGFFLNKFSIDGTVSNKIVKVVSDIKKNLDEKLNIKDLANSVDMSESSFYHHFKTITSLSPIQFQKKLRLEESKNLLYLKDLEINEVAFQVGYESPSQFSREFSRMFGMSPKAYSLHHMHKQAC